MPQNSHQTLKNSGSTNSNRMSQSNCSSVNIDFVLRNIKKLHVSDANWRKGLIVLKPVHLTERQSSSSQHLVGSLMGSNGKVNRVKFSISIAYYSCHRFKTQFVDLVFWGQNLISHWVLMVQAPSLILLALAAVIVPVLLKAGGIVLTLSSLNLLPSSSSLMTTSSFPFSLSFMGTISSVSSPFLAAYKCLL